MAATLHRVRENFIYWIEQITPTNTSAVDREFQWVDSARFSASGDSSGHARNFDVVWSPGEEDHIVGSQLVIDALNSRIAEHMFVVRLFLPASWLSGDLHNVMLDDRHDVIKQLGDPAKWVGYDASNTTTEIGLYDRVKVTEELVKEAADSDDEDEADSYVLNMVFRCVVEETE